MSRHFKRAAVAAVAVLALGWGWTAMAQSASSEHEHEHAHASNARVPLSATGGIAVSNVGQTCSESDTVQLSANAHAHVMANPKRNVVRVNIDDAQGTGALGGYELNGSHQANLSGGTIPSDGTLPATAQFRLFAEEDHCASQTVTVNLNLVFSGGKLQSSSTACVAGTTGC